MRGGVGTVNETCAAGASRRVFLCRLQRPWKPYLIVSCGFLWTPTPPPICLRAIFTRFLAAAYNSRAIWASCARFYAAACVPRTIRTLSSRFAQGLYASPHFLRTIRAQPLAPQLAAPIHSCLHPTKHIPRPCASTPSHQQLDRPRHTAFRVHLLHAICATG